MPLAALFNRLYVLFAASLMETSGGSQEVTAGRGRSLYSALITYSTTQALGRHAWNMDTQAKVISEAAEDSHFMGRTKRGAGPHLNRLVADLGHTALIVG
jgi:hypothetical protein